MLSNTDNILGTEYIEGEYMQLTEMERKVIFTLSKEGPISGYDFHLGGRKERMSAKGKRTAIMSSSTWESIKRSMGPKEKNLIERVQVRGVYSEDRRGRRKDLYWLNGRGIQMALIEGFDPDALLEKAKIIWEDNEDFWSIEFLCEVAKKMHPSFSKALLEMWISPLEGAADFRGLPIPLGDMQAEFFLI